MNENETTRFSELSLKFLQESGWYPGRNVWDSVQLPENFELLPIAVDILKEFGHLHVGKDGPGISCARTTVKFEPILADGEDERFRYYAEILRSKLYPLGALGNGYLLLAIDEHGQVFQLMDSLLFVDERFDKALDKLLTGIKSLPVRSFS